MSLCRLRVNGAAGRLYPRPQPSRSGEIRLLSGLHTTIYSDGAAEVAVPAALLRRGEARRAGRRLAVPVPAWGLATVRIKFAS